MTLVDTHSHIYLDEFNDDRKEMIERSEREGVVKIIQPAVDSTTHQLMLQTEAAFPGKCFSMMGLHPCSVKENYEEELAIAKGWLEKRAFKAVGEIGLDFYWDTTYTDQQYQAFHRQIGWALEYELPIVIHSRNSIDECIKVVSEHQKGKLRGVFHCFSGNAEQAEKIIDLGFYLGIGGVLTFKNSGMDKVMETVSLDHVLLETDAPYLSPVPFRGKRNEPGYLKYVVGKLTTIKNSTAKEVAEITTRNAENLFGKL
jgi:TatD DNase family protein